MNESNEQNNVRQRAFVTVISSNSDIDIEIDCKPLQQINNFEDDSSHNSTQLSNTSCDSFEESFHIMSCSHFIDTNSNSNDSGCYANALHNSFQFTEPSGTAPRSRSKLTNSPYGSPYVSPGGTSSNSSQSPNTNKLARNDSDSCGSNTLQLDVQFMGEVLEVTDAEHTVMYSPSSMRSLLLERIQMSAINSLPVHDTPRIVETQKKRSHTFRRCLSLNTSQERIDDQSFAEFRSAANCSPILSFNKSSTNTTDTITNTPSNENMENDSSAANRVASKRSGSEMMECDDFPTKFKVRKSLSLFTENSGQKHISIQRCRSENEAVMNAVQRSCEDRSLIGDFSKQYALPLTQGKHQDLKSINVDVLASVLRGEYTDVIEKCTIVDCRYPYEYKGGHIKGAKNIYSKEAILTEFLPDISLVPSNQDSHKRRILVFHCEFSSERGPSLYRFLRKQDRTSNEYPFLHYPELYILDGGYKAFFENYRELCEPPDYLPMHSKDHEQELRHFRAQVKCYNFDAKLV